MTDRDHVGAWVGVVLGVIGLVLIAVSWGQVASRTDVGLQMPYIISAGVSGLGFVVIGLGTISISARRRQAAHRSEQLQQLAATLDAIRTELQERS